MTENQLGANERRKEIDLLKESLEKLKQENELFSSKLKAVSSRK